VKVATIGFTQKPLRRFVDLLRGAEVDLVVDIRLHNKSQLAGWSKRDDLDFILKTFGIGYTHRPALAPSAELLDSYRKSHNWTNYEQEYPRLLEERQVYDSLHELLSSNKRACFLCSEAQPERCHRRLLCEQLRVRYPTLEVIHLV
jgi:uncharacterized protein (DUF488 family)